MVSLLQKLILKIWIAERWRHSTVKAGYKSYHMWHLIFFEDRNLEQGRRKNHTKECSDKHRAKCQRGKRATRMAINYSFHFVFGIEIDPLKRLWTCEWLVSEFNPRKSKKSKNRKSDFKFWICMKNNACIRNLSARMHI